MLTQNMTLTTQQQLLMTASLQQALAVLQLPIEALAEWIKEESEKNPLLEIEEKKSSAGPRLLVPDRAALPSLYERLLLQLPLAFEDAEERKMAKEIIGNLNEKGFLEEGCSQDQEVIRKRVLHLDPPGVGCLGVQDYLLFQLEGLGCKEELIYLVVKHHFPLLLEGKWSTLSSLLQIEEYHLKQQVQHRLTPLRLSPADPLPIDAPSALVPDLIFSCEEDQWRIEVNCAPLPRIRVKHWRLKGDEGRYVQEKRRAVKWLIQACQKRKETLFKIGKVLLQKQRAFFLSEGRGQLIPLTCKEVAEELGMHESTIARAIAQKYLSCPSGMFKMEKFFKQGVASSSNESIKEVLKRIVDQEDKRAPLSDKDLLEELKKRGMQCARRTVVKYRDALKIPAAEKRKLLV